MRKTGVRWRVKLVMLGLGLRLIKQCFSLRKARLAVEEVLYNNR